jgi:3-oxoacyl-[acyl-carrier protein] reductase
MDLKLLGKRALVTGSSAGLGEATATLLAEEGVEVVVHGRNEGRANAVAEAIRAKGSRADVAIGDLATDSGADAVATAATAGGAIDILVNNAGSYEHRSWSRGLPGQSARRLRVRRGAPCRRRHHPLGELALGEPALGELGE